MGPKLTSKYFIFAVGLVVIATLVTLIRPPTLAPLATPSNAFIEDLPLLLFFSFARMLAAFIFSMLFALVFGLLAASNERRAKVILPLIDILQSIPVLGFFPSAIFWFTRGPDDRIGLEIAAIFLIFTCMAWNLVFAIFEGIKSLPEDAIEAGQSMGLGKLGMMRRIYLPACLSRLIDNSLLSWANGWYFLVACEIIALGNLNYELPGIGSFLARCIENSAYKNLIVGILALSFVILLLDLFVWRPLSEFAKSYNFGSSDVFEDRDSLSKKILKFYRYSKALSKPRKWYDSIYSFWIKTENLLEPLKDRNTPLRKRPLSFRIGILIFWLGLFAVIGKSIWSLAGVLFSSWAVPPLKLLAALSLSSLRILAGYFLCLIIILPLVYKLHRIKSKLVDLRLFSQVIASIPATALFPVLIFLSLKFIGSVELTAITLAMTGMFWYLLFNIVGGASLINPDIIEASDSLGIRGFRYWIKVFLPAIGPALVTGSITAIGGGWNSLFLSEAFSFRGEQHSVFGIGSLLYEATYKQGSQTQMALILFVMVTFIVLVNRYFWQPLYDK